MRRSRTGVLLGAVHELDADLLGIVLRRRRDEPPSPPGRGHLVAAGAIQELQVAIGEHQPSVGTCDQEGLAAVGPLVGSAGQRCFG